MRPVVLGFPMFWFGWVGCWLAWLVGLWLLFLWVASRFLVGLTSLGFVLSRFWWGCCFWCGAFVWIVVWGYAS